MRTAIKSAISPFAQPKTEPNANAIRLDAEAWPTARGEYGSMRLPEIESPVQNISTHPSLEPRVPRIAIVGAGFVGSTTAFALMMSGMAAEIVLIDRDSRRAEGHVNDLRDAEVFSHTTRIFVGDFSDCCSADVTIVTAGVSQSGQKSRMEGLHDTGAILHGLVNDVC